MALRGPISQIKLLTSSIITIKITHALIHQNEVILYNCLY